MKTSIVNSVKKFLNWKRPKEERSLRGTHLKKVKLGSTIVEMKMITKRFPGVIANDHIDFELKSGEIHALLGENGAGKTTLMNILYGLYSPDEGETYVYGRRVTLGSPQDAINLGIGMVHQHFTLASALTVTENIILGLEPRKGGFLDLKKAEERIVKLSKRYGFGVDPKAKIWQLSVGEQQRVEILKALYRNVNVLVLDEPTSVLSPLEVEELFKAIRKMANEGSAIVFITHKLKEVMAIADRITILRKGKAVSTVEPSKADERKLARMMVGREVSFQTESAVARVGDVVLKVKDLQALDDRGLLALKKVSFTIHKGEILGIAGVSGNGQRELAEVIANLRKATKGKILFLEQDVTNRSPRETIEQRIAYIPEDRVETGLIRDLTLTENVILKVHNTEPFVKKGILNNKIIAQYTEKLISEYEVKTRSIYTPVRHLSGGNIQRLLLARELASNPKLVIAAQPTRGLDVKSTMFIHNKLIKQKKNGMAILLISEDLDEIMTLSDRIAVMYEGEIVGISPSEKASIERIGLMMTGMKS